MLSHEHFDIAIIGAGVIGSTIAHSLLSLNPDIRLCVIDKETAPAMHQSGHNSGVVHVGYNQKPGTVKARFVVEGSLKLREFCIDNGVPIEQNGILVVAASDDEIETLHILKQRADANGAKVCIIDEAGIREIEPYAKGTGALFAPEGASFNPKTFVDSIIAKVTIMGGSIFLAEKVVGLSETGAGITVSTDRRKISTSLLINAGGLHADRIAHMIDAGRGYRIIPFRGDYWQLTDEYEHLVRSHIYPVPDLKFPFLGVHLSRTTDGHVLVGPSSVLPFSREAYDRFNFNARDVLDTISFIGFYRMLYSKDMRRLIGQEWKKSLFLRFVYEEAAALIKEIKPNSLKYCKSGIRAQMVSSDGQLVDDMLIEETARSINILNAVSPALTCSLPFADDIAQKAIGKLSRP